MKNYGKQVLALCAGALLLGSMTSCFYLKKNIASAELSEKYTRTATETGALTDEFVESLSKFSFSLFQKTVTNDDKNDLVSPISAALCLALVNNGANGNTRAQLESLFGMPTDELNRSLYAYTSALPSSKDCKVNIANSIWFKENALNVKPSFLQANADWYQAQAYATPFDQTTVTDINNWCSNETEGKINKILDQISSDSLMYLINAVDFDAKWNVAYEKSDIDDRIFYNYNATEKRVDFLNSKENTYLADENAVGFTRPYKGGAYNFVALLPNEGVDIYDYVMGLTGERWLSLWENSTHRVVNAKIPEFTYELEMDLMTTLQRLGVTDMFSPALADFSNIDETQSLYCDTVKQKTFIQLDRNGTKAAAITLVGMIGASAPPTEIVNITLDRPFVYAIVDSENHLPLFLGAVTKL